MNRNEIRFERRGRRRGRPARRLVLPLVLGAAMAAGGSPAAAATASGPDPGGPQGEAKAAGLLGVVAVDDGRSARLAEVLADSPAAAAGLQAGDSVRRIGRTRIGSAEEVTAALADVPPGAEVAIQVARAGKTVDLKATLADPTTWIPKHLKRVPGAELVGKPAPGWIAASWDGVSKRTPAPELEALRGKVIVFHCFQAW